MGHTSSDIAAAPLIAVPPPLPPRGGRGGGRVLIVKLVLGLILTAVFAYGAYSIYAFFSVAKADSNWAPATYTAGADIVLLSQGASMYSSTLSPPSPYSLKVQDDGNVVLYDNKFARWASNTDGKGTGPFQLTMQADGNLVLYASGNNPTWSSATDGKGTGPYRLVLRDTPELVVLDSTNTALWSSVSTMRTPWQFLATTTTPVQFSSTSMICGVPDSTGKVAVGVSDGKTCTTDDGVAHASPYQLLDSAGAIPQWYSNSPNAFQVGGSTMCHYKVGGADKVGVMNGATCGATSASVFDQLKG